MIIIVLSYSFNSDLAVQILDSLCDDEQLDCNNLLSSITGMHCQRNFFFVNFCIFHKRKKNDVFACVSVGWGGGLFVFSYPFCFLIQRYIALLCVRGKKKDEMSMFQI